MNVAAGSQIFFLDKESETCQNNFNSEESSADIPKSQNPENRRRYQHKICKFVGKESGTWQKNIRCEDSYAVLEQIHNSKNIYIAPCVGDSGTVHSFANIAIFLDLHCCVILEENAPVKSDLLQTKMRGRVCVQSTVNKRSRV